MKESTKQGLKDIGNFALDILDGLTLSLERSSRSHARDKTLPNKHREKYSELADNLSTFRETVLSRRESIDGSDYLCDNWDEIDTDIDDPSSYCETTSTCYIPKVYDNEEKSRQQQLSATSDNLGPLSLEQWDVQWISCGKLMQLTHENRYEVGLIRLRLHAEIVYITRAIELNQKGIHKKLHDIIYSNTKKSIIQKKIDQSLSILEVDILPVGMNSDAVCITRTLEREMIAKYNPTWLRREIIND